MQGFRPSGQPLEELKIEWQAAIRNTVRKKAVTVRIQERDIATLKIGRCRRDSPSDADRIDPQPIC
jgi:hypothetical protein